MTSFATNAQGLKGQAYVEWLSAETLRQVRVTHEERLSYVTVDLRNQANAEASAMREYHGRYLFELLQNANDAIRAAKGSPHWKRERYRVQIELTDSALIVANDGVPFLKKDVDSIYRWGESSKDPNKSIGYKGIGFKSVLEVTESPEIFSRVVQFRFDRETCYQSVREIVGADVELKLPITRFVFPYTLAEIRPSDDGELVQQLIDKHEFATVIRLPLKVSRDQVLKRLEEDLDPALLLFLGGIDEIEVQVGGRRKRHLHRNVRPPGEKRLGRDVTLYEGLKPISRWLLFDAPKSQVDDRAVIDKLEDDAWKRVERVGFAVAFRLDKRGKLRARPNESTKLFVYFPTALSTGLQYRIHGDFYIDAARKRVAGDRDYNQWLARQIASFIGSTVVPELVERFPTDKRVVQALVPSVEASDEAAFLRNAINNELRQCAFVSVVDGKARPPSRTMLAPMGASVDLVEFQRFFPTSRLSSLHGYRQFPLQSVEHDTQSTDWLVSLGAKRLTFEGVFRLFDGRDIADGVQNFTALYAYLWRWREQVGPEERSRFSSALGRFRCAVTDNGSWIKPHDQLYHAKLRQETPVMPRALRADLVHPLAYDRDGRAGPTHKLLSTLSPQIRDYDARDIIVNAIIPLFEGERFKRLPLQDRVEVYRYLFAYWQARRGEGDPEVERVKGKVQVPARFITNRRGDVWLPATQVYLSGVWTDDDRLERLYDGFAGVAFLYDVRGLEIQPDEQRPWTGFWRWLGGTTAPRLIIEEAHPSDLHWDGWREIRRDHPHAGPRLWGDYLQQTKSNHAYCPRHGDGYRQLRRSVVLEGFAELIEARQAKRLMLLYSLLAENWHRLVREGIPKAEVRCYRRDCPKYARSEEVPSFFEFLLREAAWVPARVLVNGNMEPAFYRPNQCWFVPPAESPVVRNLLPTPSTSLNKLDYRRFCRDIGMRFVDEAQINDLVDLLRHLPEQYPDPNIAVSSGRRTVPRALAALSRWVIERINNLLTTSENDFPKLEEAIPLVAREGDTLRYVSPPEPVFFADDRYHAARWRDHLPFVSLDKNWGDSARFLGLKFISQHVKESCSPGTVLEAESNRLETRFKAARPYILAAVNDQRESETQDVARYLSNLRIRVVDNLIVHRRLTIPPEKVIPDEEARVHLEVTVERRVGSAGRAPRSGILYVRKGFEENYDLLAGPIAEFVRIPGLADAFVILLDRGGKGGRMRYLQTRGLEEQDVKEMRDILAHLGVWDEPELDKEQEESLNRHLINQISETGKDEQEGGSEFEDSEPGSKLVESATQEDEPTAPEPQPIEFPSLDLSVVRFVPVGPADGVLPAEPKGRGRSGGGGGRRDWERDQRLREAYGKRGEHLAKMWELKRLRDLGLDHPEESVRWLREEGNETADHDLESKDRVDGRWIDIVIEVKATPACDFRFHMSKGELICARRERERYRLYRVINVASASPEIYAFENPYTLWEGGKAVIEPRDTYVTLPDPRRKDESEQETGDER